MKDNDKKIDLEIKEEFLDSLLKTIDYFSGDLKQPAHFSLEINDNQLVVTIQGVHTENKVMIKRMILNKCF